MKKYLLITPFLLFFGSCAEKKASTPEEVIVVPPKKGKSFSYYPAGLLKNSTGRGRLGDNHIYAPNIRFPLESSPAYLNSQVYGIGGLYGAKGSLCDQRNYAYPWQDNYCETRTHNMPLCPAGVGHQGVDIRAKDCQNSRHYAVAVEDGIITYIGSYSIKLRGVTGRTYRYLHLNSQSILVHQGQRLRRGDRIGLVSDNMGKTKTSIHLHFDIQQTLRFRNYSKKVYIPPYTSLLDAYKRLLQGRP